jgi:hypothetical protein
MIYRLLKVTLAALRTTMTMKRMRMPGSGELKMRWLGVKCPLSQFLVGNCG